MEDCLSNALVLWQIFQHFSNRELLTLSSVSKLWNYEARSVMKNRGNLIASLLFLDDQSCQEYLGTFATDLTRMNVVPFSRISIHLGHDRCTCQAAAPNSINSSILDQVQLKSVSVDLTGDWSKNKDCPGLLLVTEILERFSGVLEQVSFSNTVSKDNDRIVGLVKDCSFPSLKILKLGENYERCDPTYIADVLKALVSRAPHLRELHTQGPINLMLEVLEGRSTKLVLQSDISINELPEDAINKIRLEKIQFHYEGPNFNVERFNRMTPRLLQEFSATLNSIHVDAILAVPLMCCGIRFENVRQLAMYINPGQMELDEPRILRILKDFDFTRVFPNLEKVFMLADFELRELLPDHMNGFVAQANAILKEPAPDRAIKIKELDLSTSVSSACEFFAEMFPHIDRLILSEQDRKISFDSIWKHWVDLKEIIVKAYFDEHCEDLDSVICGIFPDEAADLRRKDEEFLKKVNIVPVKPAITCLKNLRDLFIVLEPLPDDALGSDSLENVKPPPSLVLSKVTGLVAFARCPNLQITLSTHIPRIHEALLIHMEPYAYIDPLFLPAATELLNSSLIYKKATISGGVHVRK